MTKTRKMNEGILAEKLETVYKHLKDAEHELAYIDGDTVLNRRMQAIQDYPSMIHQAENAFNEIAVQLNMRVGERNCDLISFIFEWGIYDPSIILGFAEFMSLTYGWSNIPGRSPKMIAVQR